MNRFGIGSSVVLALLLGTAGRAVAEEPFEGCGVLHLWAEECLVFLPDSGEYDHGLLPFFGWPPGFEENDHVYILGGVDNCVSFCSVDACLMHIHTLEPCPYVPTTSAWALGMLALLILAGGTILIRRPRRAPSG